ncbi:YbaB/EbfC family nucleoid-associated protein [Spirillospora sp. NBC_00431]
MNQVERAVEEIRAAQREIEGIEETAESPDGLVSVTVSGAGAIMELDLDPRIYRNQDTRELSRQILAAINEAGAHMHRRLTEAVQRLAPESGR